jgi:EAL domain-containing protein (putative c-di-GMP-specific phosphodiesterase class I)
MKGTPLLETGAGPNRATAADPLDEVLDGGLRSVYQPIVELDTGEVVAYEALARGPEGHELESPAALFGAAGRSDRLAELDWACRLTAMRGAVRGGLEPPLSLFVNVEPEATKAPPPNKKMQDEKLVLLDRLQVVFEVTERALTDQPAELLDAVARMRSLGCGIALDDVGADRRSLALMPLLQPDVIKLDLSLVQNRPTTEIAVIAGAVHAQAESTGATVLAEGIETEEHAFTALALGATLGQGWLYGRPGPLAEPAPAPKRPVRVRPRGRDGQETPFQLGSQSREPRIARHRLLVAMSKELELFASAAGGEGVVVGSFQTAPRFTPRTRDRYSRLADDLPFVAALGAGLECAPAPGVRGGELASDDPLLEEWAVVVLGPHVAAALSALDLGDEGPNPERRFEFVVSYDRSEVVEMMRRLLLRISAV